MKSASRAGPASPWIERGHLDGLTVRVSLDSAGAPFMVDVMNNCGCYHFFLPQRERVKQIIPQPMATDAFVPRWLPADFPHKPLSLWINSGWHLVNHGAAENLPSSYKVYQLLPYESIEMLPRTGSTTASIFDAAGIAKNSSRIEPLILFSMGIPAIGSMRQRGHHAIKL
ncbi:MAG: hypothetical protein JRI77_10265, partial [Deltaproteobacteria bacterium]|nr:hypothetical protein [Deltaproteobacteria bacterium]